MRRNTERFGKFHLKTYPGAGGDDYEIWRVVDNKTGASLRISMPSAFARETGLTDKSLLQDFQYWYETWWREENDQPKKKPRRYKKR